MNEKIELLLSGCQFRRMLDREFADIEKRYGLCRIDVQILFYLCSAGDNNTAGDIVNLGFFTKGHVSQSLSRLKNRKFIRLERDEQDRRRLRILLEEKTEEITRQIQQIEDRIDRQVLRGISEQEMQTFRRIAQKIMENINSGG